MSLDNTNEIYTYTLHITYAYLKGRGFEYPGSYLEMFSLLCKFLHYHRTSEIVLVYFTFSMR